MKPRSKAQKSATKGTARARQCALCGATKGLTRTECCDRWICDDEDEYVLFSYARTSCARNHRRYTLCGGHHAEGHEGRWQQCEGCREKFKVELYVYYGTNKYNFEKLENPPAFAPTMCSECQHVIRLGLDGYAMNADGYSCERCAQALISSLTRPSKLK